ncbi:hypothetical protein HPMG_01458 [Helicobacter pullorum MIT 98-5489]|uniref:Uncharacterized protein n=1 Tax=Helicobacter pullorum MIT 98-5489 TaxID=537972 RepID=C5F0I8_9HELI|nr:hypothetical protein HPMG_01458 [Helicobacter pullorum MIT 98-5489]
MYRKNHFYFTLCKKVTKKSFIENQNRNCYVFCYNYQNFLLCILRSFYESNCNPRTKFKYAWN